jgi:group I intron endonuclease
MAIIYKATNTITGSAYVGYTSVGFESRRSQHLSDARTPERKKTIFHRAINKYGEDAFHWEILLEDATLDDEIRLICEHMTHKTHGGYNITLGGEGNFGLVHSDEAKLKMSMAHKGIPKSEEHKRKIGLSHQHRDPSTYNRGPKSEEIKVKMRKPKSEEHKRKIALAKLGKPRSPEMQEKLRTMRKGLEPWNKGLSVETDERVKLNIERRLETVRAQNATSPN